MTLFAALALLAVAGLAALIVSSTMDEDHREPVVLLGAVLVAVAIRACGSPLYAHADPPRDEALDLARLTYHEAGPDSPDDCAAIFAVARNRGVSVRAMGRHLFAGTTRRAPWILELDESGDRPAHLERAAWTHARGERPSLRDAWLATLAHAREVVLAPPVCEARGWGSAHDMERARLRGRVLTPVDCGHTRNVFYVEGRR